MIIFLMLSHKTRQGTMTKKKTFQINRHILTKMKNERKLKNSQTHKICSFMAKAVKHLIECLMRLILDFADEFRNRIWTEIHFSYYNIRKSKSVTVMRSNLRLQLFLYLSTSNELPSNLLMIFLTEDIAKGVISNFLFSIHKTA